MPIVVISGNGDSNIVTHCIFNENIDNQEVQVESYQRSHSAKYIIANNNFSDKKKVRWSNSNGGECVQDWAGSNFIRNYPVKTTVRDNRFIRCNGEPEVISNKSSNNLYKRNYFENCDGELVMRGGHDCVIDSNVIKGGNSGIRVNGTGH
jgi:hypothetical protein